MKIELDKIYRVEHCTGKIEDVRLIELIERSDTYRLHHFGYFLHAGSYYKYYYQISKGIQENGFYIHNGYRLIGSMSYETRFGHNGSHYLSHRLFYTCVAVIRDEYDRIVDPHEAMRLYDSRKKKNKKAHRFDYSWTRSHGERRKVYGHRHRKAFQAYKEYESNAQLRSVFNPIPIDDDDIYEWYDDESLIPKIRKTSTHYAFLITESWYDAPERHVEKSWKYQSKRDRQWKHIK